jgi:hypothetical protein
MEQVTAPAFNLIMASILISTIILFVASLFDQSEPQTRAVKHEKKSKKNKSRVEKKPDIPLKPKSQNGRVVQVAEPKVF